MLRPSGYSSGETYLDVGLLALQLLPVDSRQEKHTWMLASLLCRCCSLTFRRLSRSLSCFRSASNSVLSASVSSADSISSGALDGDPTDSLLLCPAETGRDCRDPCMELKLLKGTGAASYTALSLSQAGWHIASICAAPRVQAAGRLLFCITEV